MTAKNLRSDRIHENGVKSQRGGAELRTLKGLLKMTVFLSYFLSGPFEIGKIVATGVFCDSESESV